MPNEFEDLGFVLHSRRFRENSRIVEVLTRRHGRISLIARPSGKKGTGELAALQPWCESRYRWRGKHDLQNLAWVEVHQPFSLNGENSICGLYCNELLQYLLARQLPCRNLYACYHDTIAQLASGERAAPRLRKFEDELLRFLGFSLDYSILDAYTDNPDSVCYFHPDHGLTPAPMDETAVTIDLATLNQLQQQNFADKRTAAVAKSIFGATLDSLLEGKPLRSRKLLQSYRKYTS